MLGVFIFFPLLMPSGCTSSRQGRRGGQKVEKGVREERTGGVAGEAEVRRARVGIRENERRGILVRSEDKGVRREKRDLAA